MESEPSNPTRLLLFGVALVALCTLLFEVLLTRIFAVTMWYHFGFLAISLAMMGTATAAVMCFIFPERLCGSTFLRNMLWSAAGFGVMALVSVIVHLEIRLPGYSGAAFYGLFSLQLLLLFAAFFSSGLCITISLSYFSRQIGRVYFFDLCGAGVGSCLVVPLLFAYSGLALVFLVSAIALVAAALFAIELGRKRLVAGAAILATVLVIAGVNNDEWELLSINATKSYRTNARNDLQSEEIGKVYEKWSPVSRVAVFAPRTDRDGVERMSVTADAGAPTVLRRFNGDLSKVSVDDDCRQVAQHIARGNVAIIGSAGGTDVLSSLAFGQERITAVEINPVTAKLVTEDFAEYIGNIFQNPRVTLHVREGRNFIAGSDELYDLIQLTMIDSWAGAAAGAYLFNENSLYTVEAVSDYYDHLKDGGFLSITRYLRWNEAFRLTNMYLEMLERRGIPAASKRIIVLAERPRDFQRATVLLKKGEVTPEEVATVNRVAGQCGGNTYWAPGADPSSLSVDLYAGTFRDLINASVQERAAIVANQRDDLSAPTDDRPFFFFTTRLRDIFDPPIDEHAARRLAMPILYGMLGVFALLALLTVLVPLYVRSGREIRDAPNRNVSLLYFSMLGAGFMLVEISLIQRLTVFLGHPIWSFVLVLATLLFASGLGSFWSERFRQRRERVLTVLLAGIVVVLLLYIVLLYDLFIDWMAFGMPVRLMLAGLAIAPVGFLLGSCFPLGMQIVQKFHRALVPWGWGVNGVFSVFASVLSLVIAINLGFKATLGIGVLCYFIAAVVANHLRKQAEAGQARVAPAAQ